MLTRLFDFLIGFDVIKDLISFYGITPDSLISCLSVESFMALYVSVSFVVFVFIVVVSFFIYFIYDCLKIFEEYAFSNLGFLKSICIWLFKKVYGELFFKYLLIDYLKDTDFDTSSLDLDLDFTADKWGQKVPKG